jgi:hypothetical protein
MFLRMVGAPQPDRQAENRLERSLDIVHRNFDKVLKCVAKLEADIIRPGDPEFRTTYRRLQNSRFNPHFNNCKGAIDGTHIPVVVPNDKVVQLLCRKGCTTQNVLAVYDFDMRFIFVLVGWPGSIHDTRVFNNSTNKYKDMFPRPPPGIILSMFPHATYMCPHDVGFIYNKKVHLCREVIQIVRVILHLTRKQNTIFQSFETGQCREV